MKNHSMKKYLIATSMLAAVGFAGSSHAVDGVFEISESCASSFGCFDGDSAGFPVTITESGSYRLTSNIIVSSPIVSIIAVNADNVSIDLNGFSLIGPATCSGATLTCSQTGVGIGINANGQENITIRNGIISGMGNDGIVVGRGAYLEELVVAENGGEGIDPGAGSVLRRLVVRENGGNGVQLGFSPVYIMDSTVFNNGVRGVNGGFCGNVLMSGNDNGDDCTAIAPNQCSPATDCD